MTADEQIKQVGGAGRGIGRVLGLRRGRSSAVAPRLQQPAGVGPYQNSRATNKKAKAA